MDFFCQLKPFPSGHLRPSVDFGYGDDIDFPSLGTICLLDDIDQCVVTWKKEIDGSTPQAVNVEEYLEYISPPPKKKPLEKVFIRPDEDRWPEETLCGYDGHEWHPIYED